MFLPKPLPKEISPLSWLYHCLVRILLTSAMEIQKVLAFAVLSLSYKQTSWKKWLINELEYTCQTGIENFNFTIPNVALFLSKNCRKCFRTIVLMESKLSLTICFSRLKTFHLPVQKRRIYNLTSTCLPPLLSYLSSLISSTNMVWI